MLAASIASSLAAVSLQQNTLAQQSFGNGFMQSLQQGFGQPTNNALENPSIIRPSAKLPDKERKLEDFFPKVELPYIMPPPYDMTGLKVTGLDAKYVPALGQNLFVVVENTPYTSMADIYRENRLKGKSSFVTADCIVHAYFALNNAILRDVLVEKVTPGLSLMLQGMLKESFADYKECEDADVKLDISKNIIYLVVGLQLLDPRIKVTIPASMAKAAEAEMKNINAGKTAKSAIFGNQEEYAYLQPCGFYNNDAKLKNFYRCRQWLSRIQFPLSESELSDAPKDSVQENRFRQSVLLFRSLDKATINGAPAMTYWIKFSKVWEIMGSHEAEHEHALLPSDYKNVFRTSSQNLSNVLQGLSEPFYRTKLLLSIRRNRPVEIGSSSILNMQKADTQEGEKSVFRLMPAADEPELPWFSEVAQDFTEERSESESTPFSLLELYARSSTLATNVLSEITWKLSSELFTSLPKLNALTARKKAQPNAAADAGSQEGRWAILSTYFKPMTESTQNVLKSNMWMKRRLLSAFAGWVDSHVAMLESEPPKAQVDTASKITVTTDGQKVPEPPPTAAAGTTIGAASGSVQARANSSAKPVANYLEPAPVLYKSIHTKMQQTLDELNSLEYLPARYKATSENMITLSKHLEDIARKELSNNFVSPPDSRFLSSIDQELDRFPCATQGTMHLGSDTVTDKSGKIVSGANLCIGRPGLVFMLLKIGRGQTLSRGAMYTYYEVPGGPLKPEHWERKLQFATIQPPRWTADFEVQQPIQPLEQAQTESASPPAPEKSQPAPRSAATERSAPAAKQQAPVQPFTQQQASQPPAAPPPAPPKQTTPAKQQSSQQQAPIMRLNLQPQPQ
jgi:hypothetical protein